MAVILIIFTFLSVFDLEYSERDGVTLVAVRERSGESIPPSPLFAHRYDSEESVRCHYSIVHTSNIVGSACSSRRQKLTLEYLLDRLLVAAMVEKRNNNDLKILQNMQNVEAANFAWVERLARLSTLPTTAADHQGW
jgi:hypothetical protein